jgi:hypothetical protein
MFVYTADMIEKKNLRKKIVFKIYTESFLLFIVVLRLIYSICAITYKNVLDFIVYRRKNNVCIVLPQYMSDRTR